MACSCRATHYHYQICLKRLSWKACLKKTKIELQLLTDTDILQMIEEGIRRRICHVIHRYANENNKYMKNYNKDKESVYLMYWDANNFYGCAMTQKLLINSL